MRAIRALVTFVVAYGVFMAVHVWSADWLLSVELPSMNLFVFIMAVLAAHHTAREWWPLWFTVIASAFFAFVNEAFFIGSFIYWDGPDADVLYSPWWHLYHSLGHWLLGFVILYVVDRHRRRASLQQVG